MQVHIQKNNLYKNSIVNEDTGPSRTTLLDPQNINNKRLFQIFLKINPLKISKVIKKNSKHNYPSEPSENKIAHHQLSSFLLKFKLLISPIIQFKNMISYH